MTWNVGTKVSARRTALGRAVGIVAAAGLMISGLSGCGEPTYSTATLYPVKGQILLSDGKPLTSGQVVLVSNQDVEFPGKVGSDGRFSIKSGAGEGAPEGEYTVRHRTRAAARDRGPSQKGRSESAFSREVRGRHDIRSESHRQARREQPGTVQARSGAVSGKVRK